MTTRQYIQFACIRTFINTSLYIRQWLSPATQPDKTKVYDDRSDLYPARIFIPKSESPTTSDKAPLVLLVHGGGFLLNNPSADDPLARQLADEARCIVVSVDYRKSPQTRFPGAYEDIVQQALSVIHDEELAIDRKRVVLAGSSAGGNLVLGAVQDSRLRGKVKGVIGLYPPVDWRLSYEERMKSRPDPDVPDFVGRGIETIPKLYLDPDVEVGEGDVRLSPTCLRTRGDLPERVFILGAEHDLLCREAEVMAERLAGSEERTQMGTGWRTSGVWWHLIKGQKHAFNQFKEKDAEREKARVKATEETYGLLVEWLRDVFEK